MSSLFTYNGYPEPSFGGEGLKKSFKIHHLQNYNDRMNGTGIRI